MRYLYFWLKFIQISLVEKMGFRANFLTEIMVEIGWSLVTVFTFEIIFYQVDSFSGWTKGEVFLIYAIFRIISSIFGMLFRKNLEQISQLINKGELDMFLLKPIDPLFHISVRQVSLERISQTVIGFILLWYATSLINLKWGIVEIGLFVLVTFFGVMIRYSFSMMIHLLVFWFEKLDNLIRLELTFTSTARFPRQVMPVYLSLFLTFVFPVMLLAAVPAELILGKLSAWYVVGLGFMALVFLLLTRLVFIKGLSRYGSASS